jgi:hypothetical protein
MKILISTFAGLLITLMSSVILFKAPSPSSIEEEKNMVYDITDLVKITSICFDVKDVKKSVSQKRNLVSKRLLLNRNPLLSLPKPIYANVSLPSFEDIIKDQIKPLESTLAFNDVERLNTIDDKTAYQLVSLLSPVQIENKNIETTLVEQGVYTDGEINIIQSEENTESDQFETEKEALENDNSNKEEDSLNQFNQNASSPSTTFEKSILNTSTPMFTISPK